MRGVRPQEVDEIAEELRARYDRQQRPYELISVGSGWVLRLRESYRQFGRILEQRARQVRLGEEALDTLAVVAWNQPVRRDGLVSLGCDARPTTLRQLVRRGLLRLVTGEKGEEPFYETTEKFLDVFKLQQLSDLPKPDAPPA
jgi:segregation and condensation protein B